MTKIVILALYYGRFPDFFRLWLKSCEHNPTIDFVIVSDTDVPELPKNVRLLKMSMDDFNQLADKKLKRKVVIGAPYKLCDYKPMYGLILEDYLSDYDYWGECDVDLIFGNLRKFFDKYKLEEYERFLYNGHLSIYRNTYENNRAFMLSGSPTRSWDEVVSTAQNCLFDEWNGVYGIYKSNNIPMFEKRIFADISMMYTRFRLALDEINYDNQVFYWENGAVIKAYWENGECKFQEYLYIHFKKRRFDKEKFNAKTVDSFFIGPNGFTEKKGDIKLEDVEAINPFFGDKFEEKEYKAFAKKEKMGEWKSKIKRLLKRYHLAK